MIISETSRYTFCTIRNVISAATHFFDFIGIQKAKQISNQIRVQYVANGNIKLLLPSALRHIQTQPVMQNKVKVLPFFS